MGHNPWQAYMPSETEKEDYDTVGKIICISSNYLVIIFWYDKEKNVNDEVVSLRKQLLSDFLWSKYWIIYGLFH